MTDTLEPTWLNIRIRLVENGSDWDTARMLFAPLLPINPRDGAIGLTVRLGRRNAPPILYAGVMAVDAVDPSNAENAGFLVQPLGEDGNKDRPIGAPVFVAYSDIEELLVY